MKAVFLDTSGFYAVLDQGDSFHREATEAFMQAEREGWRLTTTSYVVHETWALVQNRLGWKAMDEFLGVMLALCEVVFVDRALHDLGAARCRQARQRSLSLTDCVSLEFMQRHGMEVAIARDAHFSRQGIRMPH